MVSTLTACYLYTKDIPSSTVIDPMYTGSYRKHATMGGSINMELILKYKGELKLEKNSIDSTLHKSIRDI